MKFDMQSMMEQAQKMQQEMAKAKEEINKKEVSGESGGGMVKVRMSGSNRLLALKIDKEIVDPNDTEMLEDLIIAAVNNAGDNAQRMIEEEMGKLSGMLPNIPGLNLGM